MRDRKRIFVALAYLLVVIAVPTAGCRDGGSTGDVERDTRTGDPGRIIDADAHGDSSASLELTGPWLAVAGEQVELALTRRTEAGEPARSGDLRIAVRSRAGVLSTAEGEELKELTIPDGRHAIGFFYMGSAAGADTIVAISEGSARSPRAHLVLEVRPSATTAANASSRSRSPVARHRPSLEVAPAPDTSSGDPVTAPQADIVQAPVPASSGPGDWLVVIPRSVGAPLPPPSNAVAADRGHFVIGIGTVHHRFIDHAAVHPSIGLEFLPIAWGQNRIGISAQWWPDGFTLGSRHADRRVDANYFLYGLSFQRAVGTVAGWSLDYSAGVGAETVLFGDRFEAEAFMPPASTAPQASISVGIARAIGPDLLFRIDPQLTGSYSEVFDPTGIRTGRHISWLPGLTIGFVHQMP